MNSLKKKAKKIVPNDLKLLKSLFDRTQIKWTGFFPPLLLSFIAAALEGLSLGLIGPLGKGVIEKDFGFLVNHSQYGWVFKWLWDFSDRPYAVFFTGLVLIIFSAAILKNIFDYFSQIVTDQFSRRFQVHLKQAIFDRYLLFGKQYFDRNNSDYLRNIINAFAPAVAGGISNIYGFISSVVMLAVYLSVMIVLSWQMAAVSLLLYPIYHWSLNWLVQRIRRSSADEARASTQLNVSLGSILTGIPLVKAYATEKKEKKNYRYLSELLSSIQFSILKKQALITPIQEIITMTFTLILISVVSLIVVRDGSGSVSSFLVYFVILRRSASKLGMINRFRSQMAKLDGPLRMVSDIFSDEDKFILPEGVRKMESFQSSVEFKNLTFSYRPEVPVLKNISMVIPKGKTVAIVGETGAGKSTVINLLMRYYDCQPGSIFIDGVDIRDYTFQSLRKHIALVSQDCILFDDSIKKNILYGVDRNVNDAELANVVKKARLYDLIQKLPDKWDTLVGERGMRLSGGEKQRLSIARAMIKGAEILILDEATSALDSKTETLIQESIDDAIKDRTAIIIAHRLATIKKADHIFVLEKGRLVEQGPLQLLIAQQGRFYDYWKAQSFDV